jgi:hypothetical protein
MPLPTPTLLGDFTVTLRSVVPADLVTLTVLADAPPDDELNYKLAQGYQQDIGAAVGDGRKILKEFQLDVVLEPLAELGGTDADMPEARAALMAHMENTRFLVVTNDAGVRTLPVALGKSITGEQRWQGGNRRVTLTFVPSTMTSTHDTVDDGDWLT